MLSRRYLIAPMLSAIPTTDLYFRNICRPRIRTWPSLRGEDGLFRIGANSFVAGRDAIVCRRDDAGVVDAVLRNSDLRLTYVIDDDLAVAEADTSLPEDYRQQLSGLRDGQHAALVARARTIVVSSRNLAERFANRAATVVLDPYWSAPFAGNAHYDTMERGGPIHVGYLGSATHGGDRSFVFDVIEQLLARNERIYFTLVSGCKLRHPIGNHPRVKVLRPLPWVLYQWRLKWQRFHLLLYPMLDTPFNQGRSHNKLIEHAVVGAPGVYSKEWTFADRIVDGKTGILAENTIEAWVSAVETALADPEALRRMQGEAGNAATRLNDPAPQREFWSEHLQFDH